MREKYGNIFTDIPSVLPEEIFDTIVAKGPVTIERIVSSAHCSPKDFWYDQEQDEFVIVISGSAVVAFENPAKSHHLSAGNYLIIPAHCRHRVESTNGIEKTIWLAVHF